MERRFVSRLPLKLLLCLPFVSVGICLLLLFSFSKQSQQDAAMSQQASLDTAAKSIAAMLRRDKRLTELLQDQSETSSQASSQGPSQAQDKMVYPVLPLSGEVTLDGRRDEWPTGEPLSLGIEHLLEIHFPYALADLTAEMSLSSDDDWLYLHFEVLDDQVVYRALNSLSVHRNDHIRLAYRDALDRFHRLTVAVQQPGEITAMEVSKTGRAMRNADSVSGRWMATERGYNLEMRLPRSLVARSFSAVVVDVDDDASREVKFIMGLSHTRSEDLLGEIIFTPTELEQLLATLPYPASVSFASAPDITAGGFNQLDDYIESKALVGVGPVSVTLRQARSDIAQLSDSLTLQQLMNGSLILLVVGLATLLGYWLLRRRMQMTQKRLLALLQHGSEVSMPQGGSVAVQAALPEAGSGVVLARDLMGHWESELSAAISKISQQNDYLERMASRLNHELRTPISVVKSSLENLQSETLQASSAVYVDRASLGIARLNNILNKMSEVRRLEEALDEDEMIRFDLSALVSGCVAGYSSAYSGIEFDLLLESDEVPVTGIPELMAQLLDKLVDNAVGFSTSNEVKIRLSREADIALIRVMNQGPSLPMNQQSASLFESMTSTRRNEADSHLGLGLYIARGIADFHGATLSIANREDVPGVTVTLSVPILRLTSKLR